MGIFDEFIDFCCLSGKFNRFSLRQSFLKLTDAQNSHLQLGKIGGLGSAIACYLEMMIVCYMGNNVKDTVMGNH